MTVIIGVDPGKSGAAALLGFGEPMLVRFDGTKKEIFTGLEEFASFKPDHAWIEKVGSRPGQGVASTFNFGFYTGLVEGMLTAFDVPMSHVSPAKWQTLLNCRSKGDKNVTKQRAQELFPTITITHRIADALLIAEYGRRIHV